MSVLVMEMCKTPSLRREVLKILKVPVESEDPLVILKTMYHRWKRDANPPFCISFGVNGLHLKNYMMDSEASTNVMSLKVMKHLVLNTTFSYRNVYGICSKKVKVYGNIKYLEVYLL